MGTACLSSDRTNDFSSKEQVRQIENADEHLRAALREGGEEVVLLRIADLGRLCDDYQRLALPLRSHGIFDGLPKHSDLEPTK